MSTKIVAGERQRLPVVEMLRLRLLPEGAASVLRYLSLLLILTLAVVALFPLYWCIITSFKPPAEVATVPPSFVLKRPSLENYVDLIRGTGVANAPVIRWFWNSVLTGLASTVGVVLLASLAGYSFARKQFPWRDQIFWLIISTLLVPGWSTLIASYVLTLRMGLHDTYWVLILPGLASPFAVFSFANLPSPCPMNSFKPPRSTAPTSCNCGGGLPCRSRAR